MAKKAEPKEKKAVQAKPEPVVAQLPEIPVISTQPEVKPEPEVKAPEPKAKEESPSKPHRYTAINQDGNEVELVAVRKSNGVAVVSSGSQLYLDSLDSYSKIAKSKDLTKKELASLHEQFGSDWN